MRSEMKKGVPVVAKDQKRSTQNVVEVTNDEEHVVKKVGKGCKLKHVISKGSVSDLKTKDGSSRSCVPGKQKKVNFVGTHNPPKIRELVSSRSSTYHSTLLLQWEDPKFKEVLSLL